MKKLFFALIVSFSFLLLSGFNNSTTNSTLNDSESLVNNQTITINNTTSNLGNPWLANVNIDNGSDLAPGESRTYNVPGSSISIVILFNETPMTDPDGTPGTAFGDYLQTTGELGKPICDKTYSFTATNNAYTFNCFTGPPN